LRTSKSVQASGDASTLARLPDVKERREHKPEQKRSRSGGRPKAIDGLTQELSKSLTLVGGEHLT
jgi:hypothetical protein